MQPANNNSPEDYLVHQVMNSKAYYGDCLIEVNSYRIALDLDGVFEDVTIQTRNRMRFWIYPMNNSYENCDYVLVKKGNYWGTDISNLNYYYRNTQERYNYKDKYFICPAHYFFDGSYGSQMRNKTEEFLRNLNLNADYLINTVGGENFQVGATATQIAVSYNVVDYYPAFDVSHLPTANNNGNGLVWQWGVYEDVTYRVYRRDRTVGTWQYYSEVKFRPHYFNFIFIETSKVIDVNTGQHVITADSYVPYHENQNYLKDQDG